MRFYLTGIQSQIIDKYTQEKLGIPGLVLMEKAAEALADEIEKAASEGSGADKDKLQGFDKDRDKILAVVEGGNNGGDAVAAAWILKARGYDAYIYEINGIPKQTESYKTEIDKAREAGVEFVTEFSDTEYKVIIDGIFGVGLSREVKGVQSDAIDMINAAGKAGSFIVAVDIPSGISADSGHVLGNAVSADMTVTFEYIKYGMLLGEGRSCSGDIRCKSIGLYVPGNVSGMASVLNDGGVGMLSDPSDAMRSRREAESLYVCYEYDDTEIAGLIPARQPDSNKDTYGKVLIIAGSKDIYGAVYMAAEAAYRVGAGLVKVVTDIRNRDTLCDKLPEAMLLTYDTEKEDRKKPQPDDEFVDDFKASVKWADIILCGPGIGTGDMAVKLMELLADSLSEGQKLILDADALNVMATGASRKWWEEYISKVGTGNVIITPHMMEMLRLIKSGYDTRTFDFMIKNLGYGSEMDFLKDYRKVQSYSLSYDKGVVTVLKDARTIVAYRNERDDAPGMEGYMRECPLYINTTGNSGMSKGGSGDVLAGMIAGLLAQNRDGKVSVPDIVCAAVHLHGKAGDIAGDKKGERSMIASDIIDSIPEVF